MRRSWSGAASVFFDEISVEVVLVSNASFRNKLVQLVVGIADDLAVYCFCQAIAVVVIGVLGDGRAVIVGHGLLYQSVKCVVLILNGAVGSGSGFLNLYALSGCPKGIGIFYHRCAVLVKYFLADKTVDLVLLIGYDKSVGIANSIAANRLCNYSVKIVIGVGGNISRVIRGFQDVPSLIINHGRRASRSICGLYYSACVVVLVAGDIAVCVRYGNKLADRIILVAPYISERVSD